MINIKDYKNLYDNIEDLSHQPINYQNAIILLEVRGGVDKGMTPETQKTRKGHRGDTIPICNEIIKLGWGSYPVYYSDETIDSLNEFFDNETIKGVIVRINPGQVEGATKEKLDDFLESLDKKGKVVMATPKVMNTMGAKDALYKIRELNCGLKDTEVYYTEGDLKDNLKKTLGETRVIKQNKGSSGEGIWIVEGVKGVITGDTLLKMREAVDNHKEEKTFDDFIKLCRSYFGGKEGLIVNQRFCSRISEGEIRLNMIADEVVSIILKKPKEGSISATLSSGAHYTQYAADDPMFSNLINLWNQDKGEIMMKLGLSGKKLPLIWTADFIRGEPNDEKINNETFILGEINCSCVGITTQIDYMAPKVAKASIEYCL